VPTVQMGWHHVKMSHTVEKNTTATLLIQNNTHHLEMARPRYQGLGIFLDANHAGDGVTKELFIRAGQKMANASPDANYFSCPVWTSHHA
jgi:hypothetical protein